MPLCVSTAHPSLEPITNTAISLLSVSHGALLKKNSSDVYKRQVTHDVIIPYLRMWVGPMDYTPGAMLNAHPETFYENQHEPMSQNHDFLAERNAPGVLWLLS